ncbi:unannotated protein [freshwater metagenome]|uniref:Unannotated protein n=1 Tax=freshwater metagenome TaxID=449393 RepID=A0A6J6JIK7_9ZZZZ|nr:hypothetical protein [Actinomycetota bacterium]
MKPTPYDDSHEILPNLFMGGSPFDTRVDDENREFKMRGFDNDPRPFDAIITLFPKAFPAGYGVEELRFGFPDDLASGVSDEYRQRILDLAVWGYSKWQSGAKVLVRCAAGENRSGLITLLILQKHGFSTDEAVNLIRNARQKGAPLHNEQFIAFARAELGKY